MSAPDLGTPLGEARKWLRARVDEGETCPCCSQRAQIYRRKITVSSALALIAMYRAGGVDDFVHLPTVLNRKQADEAKMTYWGLIEQRPLLRPDGSNRAGWWRVTPAGEDWVLGRTSIAKYARVYDGRCLGLDATETVTIRDALGTQFRYDELMAGV